MRGELFNITEERFSFESHGVTIDCQRLDVPNFIVFKVEFSSNRNPIVIARAEGMDTPYFWTSIPEGRQKEAEGVGKLIEEYLQNKK